MGALLSLLPLSAFLGSCGSGLTLSFTAHAASAFMKPCHLQSSVATRVAHALLLLVSCAASWIVGSDGGTKWLRAWAPWFDSCKESCLGPVAVQRISLASFVFHMVLAVSLIDVRSTRQGRAVIQNGFWGLKLLGWAGLVSLSFMLPVNVFVYWSRISVLGAAVFVVLGLVLLVDFAHSWSETCLRHWEQSEGEGWKWILLGSTGFLYTIALVLTLVLFSVFTGEECGANAVLITINLFGLLGSTILSILPAVQDANPKSGLAQAAMVAAYCTYTITSAMANHDSACNPLTKGTATRTTTGLLGTAFTFAAIAYSTSRAATSVKGQAITLDSLEREGLLEDEEETLDDEKHATRYSYASFHVIFGLGAMYVGMLLTDWQTISTGTQPDATGRLPILIGRSTTAMWIRIVSSWLAYALYAWTLIAPVLLPDRFE